MASASSNVVGIPGLAGAIPPGQCDENVVALLEDWLDRAKRGEIIGLCIAGVKAGHGTSTEWGGRASCDDMLAAATGLAARVQQAWISSVEMRD